MPIDNEASPWRAQFVMDDAWPEYSLDTALIAAFVNGILHKAIPRQRTSRKEGNVQNRGMDADSAESERGGHNNENSRNHQPEWTDPIIKFADNRRRTAITTAPGMISPVSIGDSFSTVCK